MQDYAPLIKYLKNQALVEIDVIGDRETAKSIYQWIEMLEGGDVKVTSAGEIL